MLSSDHLITLDFIIVGVFFANSLLIFCLFLWNRWKFRAELVYLTIQVESNTRLIKAVHEEVRDLSKRIFVLEEKIKK